MSGYELPAEPAAERAMLGAILRAGVLPPDVEALVRAEDFDDPHRADVYATMVDLSGHGKPCDAVSVLAALNAATKRALANGVGLIELQELAPAGALDYHAQIVAEVAERRRYTIAGLRIVQLARAGDSDADLGDLIRQTIDAVPRGGKHQDRTAWEVLEEILSPKREIPGIRMGLRDLDDHIKPLRAGAITAIGARSGVGKTTFALDRLRNACYRQGKKGLFISIEMTAEEVYTKLLSAEAGVDHSKLMLGHTLTVDEEAKVAKAAALIGNGTLYVADVDSLTLADFRALVREYGPALTAIDFLALCTFGKAERHELAISEFVYGVKRVSAEEQTHTMILSQFNRGAASRSDKRPVMDDFKDSAALEHAAHLALMIHRPDLHDVDDRPGEVDIIIGKQRAGSAGQHIALAAQLRFSRFEAMAPEPAEPRDVTQPYRHQDTA